MFFLDTNTVIYFLNGKFNNIREKILATPPHRIKIPVIVKAELLLGAYKSNKRKTNQEKVESFLEPFEIIPFSNEMAYVYATIRSQLEKKGRVIGPNDLLIAAIVRYFNSTLITNNQKEFKLVPDLKLENWAI